MGFSRQEHWSKLPFPPPSGLPDPGIKPMSPVWQADSLPLSQLGNPPCKAGVPKGCWVLKTEILMGPCGWARRLPQPLEPPLPTTLWDLVTLAFHVLHCPVPLPTLGPFCVFSPLPRMPFPSLPSQLIFTHTPQERAQHMSSWDPQTGLLPSDSLTQATGLLCTLWDHSQHTHTHLWSLIYAGLYYTAGYLSFPRHQAHSRGSRWACLQNGRTKWLADVACYNPG